MKRRGKKRAIIAVARMMLTAIFAMFKTEEVFNPCDLQTALHDPEGRELKKRLYMTRQGGNSIDSVESMWYNQNEKICLSGKDVE